jgi:hypothetical protein
MSTTEAYKVDKRNIRRSLSKWYNGKSRSFTSLADAQRLGGAGGLRKPEHSQARARSLQKRTMVRERDPPPPPVDERAGCCGESAARTWKHAARVRTGRTRKRVGLVVLKRRHLESRPQGSSKIGS